MVFMFRKNKPGLFLMPNLLHLLNSVPVWGSEMRFVNYRTFDYRTTFFQATCLSSRYRTGEWEKLKLSDTEEKYRISCPALLLYKFVRRQLTSFWLINKVIISDCGSHGLDKVVYTLHNHLYSPVLRCFVGDQITGRFMFAQEQLMCLDHQLERYRQCCESELFWPNPNPKFLFLIRIWIRFRIQHFNKYGTC